VREKSFLVVEATFGPGTFDPVAFDAPTKGSPGGLNPRDGKPIN
jgi:hypothetical protein